MRARKLSLLVQWLLVAMVGVGAEGCVTSPVHNQIQPSIASPISLQAFTPVQSSPVRVQCRPYLTGSSFTTLATFNSGTSALHGEQGDLFIASGSVVVPAACWYHWHSQYTTELRFMGGPYTSGGAQQPLTVYDAAGVDCVVSDYLDGVDYVTIQNHCGLKTSSGTAAQSIYVHAED